MDPVFSAMIRNAIKRILLPASLVAIAALCPDIEAYGQMVRLGPPNVTVPPPSPYALYSPPPAAINSSPWAQSAQAESSAADAGETMLAGHSVASYLNPPPAPSCTKQKCGFGNLPPICDQCPDHGYYAMVSYDSFRGISDGGWQNNGIVTGANFGTKLGAFSDLTGIGFQAGGTIGVFDWLGTDYRTQNQTIAQTQGFITYGFFRKANENSPLSGALLQDWMINSNYGIFGENPTMSQLRGQIAYAVSAKNEFGVWAAVRVMGDTRFVPGFGIVSWRPIDQVNFFWHHKWTPFGADTLLWVGFPEHDRMTGNGSLGDYIAGAQAQVPLSDLVSLYSLVTYMHPSSAPGPAGAEEDAWNFTIGLWLYPQRAARSSTVAGQCWMPLMPVANNGYFLTDTNRVF